MQPKIVFTDVDGTFADGGTSRCRPTSRRSTA